MSESDPARRVSAAFDALESLDDPAVFVSLADRERSLARLDADLPLAGLTFAVKDNIDVAGLPTTAGCPSFAYEPTASATTVARLEAAGAICVGKTNLDQFATGLVGTRSPYGVPVNPIDARLVPGGSSSGSAVAVARGLVDFSLGTDTAGSGRVPAAQCRIIGLKPTRGRLSIHGVVPAVRSIDCVSVFTRSLDLAWTVLTTAQGHDPLDPFSRRHHTPPVPRPRLRLGIPQVVELDGALDRAAWQATIDGIAAAGLGLDLVPVDIAPLVEAGMLLYGGPVVAERYAAVGDFLATGPDDADPTVRAIIMGALGHSAVDAANATYRLAELRAEADRIWADVDVIVVPTTPGPATLAEVAADPIGRNSRLGRYTNWVNLLDQSALAVPGVDRADGWPFGITLLAPAWADATLVSLAAQLRAEPDGGASPVAAGAAIDVAVVGAHLAGQPLNHQLTDLGAQLVAETVTAPRYRLYALAGGPPFKPGLVHVGDGGSPIAVEVWRLPIAALGSFAAQIPAPLGLGRLELADGSSTTGFIAEPRALDGAIDITEFGGWRAYRSSAATSSSSDSIT